MSCPVLDRQRRPASGAAALAPTTPGGAVCLSRLNICLLRRPRPLITIPSSNSRLPTPPPPILPSLSYARRPVQCDSEDAPFVRYARRLVSRRGRGAQLDCRCRGCGNTLAWLRSSKHMHLPYLVNLTPHSVGLSGQSTSTGLSIP